MKTSFFIFCSILFSVSVNARIVDKAIYGEDDRQDIFETKNQLLKRLSLSTAAMISDYSVLDDLYNSSLVHVFGKTLEDTGVCSDEKFAKQKTTAICSGFLVGPDLLVTAGHCIRNMDDCESNFWVFDYGNIIEEKNILKLSKKNIYRCAEIISHSLDRITRNDYALIRLDRITDRSPLEVRKSGKIKNRAKLATIGNPSGLPTKISGNGEVRKNKNDYFFQTNLDTFHGNSGAPVIDLKTGLVEGILVRGEKDYEIDKVKNCLRPKVCKMKDCRGEDVTRITNIKELMD